MPLSPRFTEALAFTAALHANQRRKISGAPYVGHLLAVAGIALQYGGSEDEAIAALLHDAAEDQGGEPTLDEIRRRFGPAVAEIVAGCSENYTPPKPPWQQRKETHLAALAHASPSIRLVVAADKLDNARGLLQEYRARGETLWGHFHGGREGTLWYYRAAVDELQRSGTTPLADELARAVRQLEQLAAGQIPA
jgi:(p)ppGpp synthase/HD superfamily hydrolase